MKAQVISMDLIVALPILSVALLALFWNSGSAMEYVDSYATAQSRALSLYYYSQAAVSLFVSSNMTYTGAQDALGQMSHGYGINATLDSLHGGASCMPRDVCRVVVLGAVPYLLVIGK